MKTEAWQEMLGIQIPEDRLQRYLEKHVLSLRVSSILQLSVITVINDGNINSSINSSVQIKHTYLF